MRQRNTTVASKAFGDLAMLGKGEQFGEYHRTMNQQALELEFN